jgi:hypothetical protein
LLLVHAVGPAAGGVSAAWAGVAPSSPMASAATIGVDKVAIVRCMVSPEKLDLPRLLSLMDHGTVGVLYSVKYRFVHAVRDKTVLIFCDDLQGRQKIRAIS